MCCSVCDVHLFIYSLQLNVLLLLLLLARMQAGVCCFIARRFQIQNVYTENASKCIASHRMVTRLERESIQVGFFYGIFNTENQLTRAGVRITTKCALFFFSFSSFILSACCLVRFGSLFHFVHGMHLVRARDFTMLLYQNFSTNAQMHTNTNNHK